MSDILSQLRERAAKQPRRIVYPEAADPRVLRAASRMVEMRMAKPVLVGSPSEVEKIAGDLGIKLSHIEIIDPGNLPGQRFVGEDQDRTRINRTADAETGVAVAFDNLTSGGDERSDVHP